MVGLITVLEKESKIKKVSLNNHPVNILVPNKRLSISEGLKEVEKILRNR